MNYLGQSFNVQFDYRVYFTSGIFNTSNSDFEFFLKERSSPSTHQKILFVIDDGVINTHPQLVNQIQSYFKKNLTVSLVEDMVIIPGGEQAKNHSQYFDSIIEAIDVNGIDRHSYVAAIGGGSVLDLAGFASAVAHRGIKHIRIPTTVLSQNDSGVGVKNGINYKNKKNFIGTFAPPVAVFNDDSFLATLSERDWRAGISEAIKVALIKDAAFYSRIEENIEKLVARDQKAMNDLIRDCAALHLQHIASGDPFELGSSRPLDFGHWSAHKLEQLSDFQIRHGEAVAMGIALDTLYSALSGRLSMEKAERILHLLLKAGFEITHPLLDIQNETSEILKGLEEFREHLGGQLTVMLLADIGSGVEVHDLNFSLLKQASQKLQEYQQTAKIKN
ncbi:3-dehydroquinate synthase [Hanamia caeni]|uniref:3-dehydroquinate synthase n=1 Tax=Hanamia caeni TaxID=2294116 RepID=A0A3M9NPW5_9BACT|nr:3-dehydroquinate synthase [Hanamia caeni]RNI39223.1 3-dehydroquinate synthase [Hanamia caeni]